LIGLKKKDFSFVIVNIGNQWRTTPSMTFAVIKIPLRSFYMYKKTVLNFYCFLRNALHLLVMHFNYVFKFSKNI